MRLLNPALLLLAALLPAARAFGQTYTSETMSTVNAPGAACAPNGALSSSGTSNVLCTSGLWVALPFTMGSANGAVCSSGLGGQVQWTGTALQFCDGSNWLTISGGAVTGIGSTGYDALWTSPTTIGTGLIYESGGQVGIGTASPLSTFSVYGGAISDTLSIGTTSTNGVVLANLTAATSAVQQFSPRLHFTGQGWKTNATAASQTVDVIEELQPVSGAANPSGNLTWSSAVNGGSYGPLMTLTSGGNVGIGTTAPTSLLSVGSLNRFTVASSGAVTAYGMNVSNGQNIIFTGYGAVNPLSGGVGLKDASDNQVLVAISGKVGIGTTSPNASALLDVYSTTQGILPPRMSTAQRNAITVGTSQIGLTIYNTDLDELETYDGATYGWEAVGAYAAVAAGTTGQAQFNNGSGDLAADSNFFWDNTNKRLGIGTGSPAQALEIAGTAKVDTGLILSLIYPPTDSTTAIQIDKANGTSNVVDIDTSNGRVGIGTTSPTATLTLGGQHNWSTGLGAITQLVGPSDQAFTIAASAPVQVAAAVAGNGLTLNASNATAGSSTVSAASGGALTLTAGNAAMLAGGTVGAVGGAVFITAGNGVTNNPSGGGNGGNVTITAGTSGPNGTGGTSAVVGGGGAGNGAGGQANLTGGTGGSGTGACNGCGGAASVSGGAAGNQFGVGGAVNITAGASGSNASGAAITLTSGNGTGAHNSGNITLQIGSVSSGSLGNVLIPTGYVGIGTTNPTSTLTLGGQENWITGLGAITHLAGPSDQAFTVSATKPVQSASTVAGNALNLYGGNASAGTNAGSSAAGGNVNITGGSAAISSGWSPAAGGAVNITGGIPASGGTGGAVSISGYSYSGGGFGGNGGAVSLAAGAGNSQSAANVSASNGGSATFSSGAGGTAVGANATGGTGGNLTITSGVGGAGNGSGGIGANSGNIVIQTGAAGTGVSANGTPGTISLGVGGATNMKIDTTGSVGIGTTSPGSTLQVNGNASIGYSTSTAGPANGLAVSGNVMAAAFQSPGPGPACLSINGYGGNICHTNTDTYQFGSDSSNFAAPTINFRNINYISNTAAGNVTFNGTRGTGTGNGGSFGFYVAPGGSSGGSQNTEILALSIVPQAGTTYGYVGVGTASPQALLNAYGGAMMDTQVSIGSTSTDGVVLQNTTAATSTVQQFSPRLHFTGQGWKTNATAASQSVDMVQELQPVSCAANPSGNLTWSSAVNGGSYSPLMTLTTGGNVGIGTTNPTSTLTLGGQESWITGLGAITHLAGPSDQAFTIAATAPAQVAASVAGNNLTLSASNATAGSSTAGAAVGGSINITAGNAAHLTSGNAGGGGISLNAGSGWGGGGGQISITAGSVQSGPNASNGGSVTISAGASSGGAVAGGALSLTAGAAGSIGTGSVSTGGSASFVSGAGGGVNGGNSIVAGNSGSTTISTGIGGINSSNSGGTGGNSGNLTISTGIGGGATGGGGTRTGGNSGNILIQTGVAGTGASANGTVGTISIGVAGATNMFINSSGLIGIGTTAPDASALLDMESTGKGFLPPRLTTANETAMGTSLPMGLMVYNTTNNELESFNGTAWEAVGAAAIDAAGSNGQVQFNNSGEMGADSSFFWDNTNKRLGIGTGSPTQALEVAGTAKIDTGLISSLIYPPTDSATAIQIDKANGTSNVVDIDTTNGRVGIGTTTPVSLLNAYGGAITETNISIGTTSTDGVVVQNTTAATSTVQQFSPRLHFTGQGWKTNATAASQSVDFIEELQPLSGAANPSGNLVWSNAINGGSYSPLMTLTSGGSVGIGTTAPNSLLQIYNATNTTKYIKVGTVANPTTTAGAGGIVVDVSGGGGFYMSDSGNGLYGKYEVNATPIMSVGTMSNHALQFTTNDSERMRITSGGNVGIGTTSPNASALLDVYSTSKGFLPPRLTTANETAMGTGLPTGLMVYNTTNNELESFNGTAWQAVGANAIDAAGSNGQVQFNNSGQMDADSNFVWDNTNKRLGIGTAVPLTNLHLYNGTIRVEPTTDKGLQIFANNLGNRAAMSLSAGSGGDEWVLVSNKSSVNNGNFAIYDQTAQAANPPATPYFNITTSGNLGIGTTVPQALLNAYGGAMMDAQVSIGSTSTDGVVLQNSTAATSTVAQYSPRLHFTGQGWKTNATAASQSVDFIEELQPVSGAANPSGNLVWSNAINGGSYSPLMTLTSGGSVGIGTTSPQQKLQVAGGGIGLSYGQGLFLNGVTYTNLLTSGWNGTNDYVNLYTAGGNGANSTPKITILSSGNVGINETTPTTQLHLYANNVFTSIGPGQSSNNGILVENGTIGGVGGLSIFSPARDSASKLAGSLTSSASTPITTTHQIR